MNIIQKKFKKFICNKNSTTNTFRIQAYNSIMSGYFCIKFIDFMLKGKSLLEYTNLFSPSEYEKNDKIIVKYFEKIFKMKKIYCAVCGKYKKSKNPKISYTLKKTLVLSIICSNCGSKDEKIFNEEESLRY